MTGRGDVSHPPKQSGRMTGLITAAGNVRVGDDNVDELAK